MEIYLIYEYFDLIKNNPLIQNYRYSIALTSQFYFCGVPFRIDTRPKCALNCMYCFAMARGGRRTKHNLISNPNFLYKQLVKAHADNNEKVSPITECLKHKLPIHFGGMSDPFSDSKATKVSLELIRIFNDFNYPVILSTKNTCALNSDLVINLLKQMKNLVVQISLSIPNPHISSLLEPNISSPSERLKTIKLLSAENIITMVRVQPLLVNYINEVTEDLIPSIGMSGAKHVIVEFLKLPVEKRFSEIKRIEKITNFNYSEYYHHNNAILTGREWVLPAVYKIEALSKLIKSIHSCNMTYGAADYGINHLGDTDCCCGIDKIKGFSYWFKGSFSNIIRKASNYIYFDSVINKWGPRHSIRMYLNSNCRINSLNLIYEYSRQKWNKPGSTNAPDSFFGVDWTGEYDKNGNCIYKKQKEGYYEKRF